MHVGTPKCHTSKHAANLLALPAAGVRRTQQVHSEGQRQPSSQTIVVDAAESGWKSACGFFLGSENDRVLLLIWFVFNTGLDAIL